MVPVDVKLTDQSQTTQNPFAQSGAPVSAQLPINLGWGSGAGTRGFVNNVNMNGRQVNDQPVSGGGSGSASGGFTVPMWAWAIAGVILAVFVMRKK